MKLIKICPKCESGDVHWCQISVRPYCNDCGLWGPTNFGSAEDAISHRNARVNSRVKDLKTEERSMDFLFRMLVISNGDGEFEYLDHEHFVLGFDMPDKPNLVPKSEWLDEAFLVHFPEEGIGSYIEGDEKTITEGQVVEIVGEVNITSYRDYWGEYFEELKVQNIRHQIVPPDVAKEYFDDPVDDMTPPTFHIDEQGQTRKIG